MNSVENFGKIASDGSTINAVINPENLNILHFNAQSLVPRESNTKFDEIRYLMDGCSLDVLGVTETWYNDFLYDSAVSISGFNLFRKDRNGRRGGGVCLYIRNNLKIGSIFDNVFDVSVESLFVEVILDDNRLVLVGVIYLPDGQFSRCEHVIEHFSSRYNNIILMGDFNTDIFSNSFIVREICERLNLHVVHNSLPTHYSLQHGSTSLIDFFLVSDFELISRQDQFQIPSLNSYHSAVFISYSLPRNHSVNAFYYHDYSQLNYDQCVSQLESMDFSGVYESLNVDDSVECFNANLLHLFEDNVPVRRIVNRGNNDWMNDTLIHNAKRVRNLAYRAYKENRTNDNFAIFCRARNKLKKVIRSIRKKYCLRFFSTCNQQQLWRKIRSVGILKPSGSNKFPVCLDEFNEFSRLPQISNDNNLHIPLTEGFSFANVTENDVLSAVLSIKSQAVGVDHIHIRFLKFIALPVLPHLTFIINRVLTTSVVPNIWKIGRIVPIPKVKTPSNCSDFRPISILSVCCKVLEIIIRDQMLTHLNNGNIIHPQQSGFRKGFSTTGILLDITESIRENLDKDRVSILIFLDYCKAFDSISHPKLITKLSRIFGFSSSACNLIYSFLSGRSQYVQVEHEVSRMVSTYRGVPQGSILGPLLFLLYVNDLFHELSFLKGYTYADDVQLLATFDTSSLSISKEQINIELTRLVEWSKCNFLQLNPTKCKFMIFSKHPIDINILLDNESLEVVTHYKTLGIILDDNLTFNHHINSVISRISWTLRRLYNVAFYLPLSIKRRIALSLCLPLLIYGIEVYSCTSVMNRSRLRVCFNKVIRYIYGVRIDNHVSEYYLDLFGCSFEKYIELRQILFFYKTIKYCKPDYLMSKFHFASSNRTHSLIYPAYSYSVMEMSFRVIVSRIWNRVIPYRERGFSHSLSEFEHIFLSNL